MHHIEVYYNSYAPDGEGPELMKLDIDVTDEAAENILEAVRHPFGTMVPDVSEQHSLNALASACEGIEQLCGRTIYQRPNKYPSRFTYGPGSAIEIMKAVTWEIGQKEDGGTDDGEEG